MKALSIKQPWASLIAQGKKTIETRTWKTNYRGPLLICASKKPTIHNLPTGCAIALVTLIGCRSMQVEDANAAQCELYDHAWSWMLSDIRPIVPFCVRGLPGLFDIGINDSIQVIIERANDLTIQSNLF